MSGVPSKRFIKSELNAVLSLCSGFVENSEFNRIEKESALHQLRLSVLTAFDGFFAALEPEKPGSAREKRPREAELNNDDS